MDERLTIGDKEMKEKVTRIKRILFLKKLGQRHFEGQINEPTPNSKEIVLDPNVVGYLATSSRLPPSQTICIMKRREKKLCYAVHCNL